MGTIEAIVEVLAGPPPVRSGRTSASLYGADEQLAYSNAYNAAQASRVTTVQSAQRLISQLGSTLPLKLVERGDRARREVRRPEFSYLWGRPNPAMNQQTFWSQQFRSSLASGNPFAWKGHAGPIDQNAPWRGITELWPLHPRDVQIVKGPNWEKLFVVGGDRDHPYGTDEMSHTPYLSDDGFLGLSPIQLHAASLGITVDGLRQESRQLRDGLRTPGVLTSDLLIEQSDAEAIVERWMQNKTGQNQRPIVLGKGAKFEPITTSPQDAQLLELLGYTREENLQIYGVTPQLLGLVTKTTSWGTGVEQLFIQMVVTVLLPFIIPFEQTYSDETLPPELAAKFAVNGLLRGDMNTRANFYRTLRMMGTMSADMILELEDLPPRGIQDDFLSPQNMERLPVKGTGPAVETDSIAFGKAPTVEVIAEARCAKGHLLGRNITSGDLFCTRCKAETHFGPFASTAIALAGEGALPRDQQDFWEQVGNAVADRIFAN